MTTDSQHRRRTRTTAGAAALVALLAAATTACGAGAADSDPHPDHRSFALSGSRLTIVAQNTDLTLAPADVDQVKVERRIKIWKAGGGANVSWSLSGSTLNLKVDCGWGLGSCSVHHVVQVPRNVTVTVQGGNGDVDASGFSTPLSITGTNGDIAATGGGTAAAVTLRTTNGDIAATAVHAGQISARTTNGDVDLSFAAVPARVSADSRSGDVTLHLPDGPTGYRLDLSSRVGTVHRGDLPTAQDDAHTISAASGTGDITLLHDGH
ncbi:DUF4097 family beta strand repeat-containing protein [Streptomyces sp. NPDC092296]|uniref:DUF4097 family beta strand repeat-containing protein n=1 Tax=Streptomyces sp. NPDC092296 TaxID=3366012 RepID=UPI003801A8D7